PGVCSGAGEPSRTGPAVARAGRTADRKGPAMDVQSLPRYRGLRGSPRGWGEPDERSRWPAMRLRDWAALSLLAVACLPATPCLVAHLRAVRRQAEALNAAREKQPEEEAVRWNR